MTRSAPQSRAVPVPAHRLSRLAQLGGMTAGIAGNMAFSGLGALSRGDRPVWRDLLITPQNISRITDQLAKMRGAAMKVGQLVSLDSGELLPPELAQIMARLRDDAHFMPPAQLKQVLTSEWPSGWLKEFANFDVRPVAAASIGQVHRATLKDGRKLAVKIQYPGIASSIDSDVANVGTLIRLSGLLPKGFELAPYLEEARKQLHQEADYEREARFLTRFQDLLAKDTRFHTPNFIVEWSTSSILTMDFAAGDPIETMQGADQTTRDAVATTLIELTLAELFDYGVMQTDPNFANYRYNQETGQIVLLDFGATREIPDDVRTQYQKLIRAGLEGDQNTLRIVAARMGFFDADTPEPFRDAIVQTISLVFDTFASGEYHDFADRQLMQELNRRGMALADQGFIPPPLPIDLLFIQRKLGGMFLLASQLGARVNLCDLMAQHV